MSLTNNSSSTGDGATGARPKTTKKQVNKLDVSVTALEKLSKVSESCGICAFPFGKQKRKPNICKHCQWTSCTECVKNFLQNELSSGRHPSCMNCKGGWSFEFLAQIVPKRWLKRIYSDKLYEEQQEAFKITLKDIQHNEEIKNYDTLIRKESSEQQSIIRSTNLYKDVLFTTAQSIYPADDAQILSKLKPIVAILADKRKQQLKCDEQIAMLQTQLNQLLKVKNVNTNSINIPCTNIFPAGNQCMGITNSSGVCCLCKAITCPKCREQIIDESTDRREAPDGGAEGPTDGAEGGGRGAGTHSCDKNVLENLTYLAAESKQCPLCHISISKIDGCDNMWCLNCKKGFHWVTLNPIIGTFHNPEKTKWEKSIKINDNGMENWLEITPDILTDHFATELWRNLFENQDPLRKYIEMLTSCAVKMPPLKDTLAPHNQNWLRTQFLEKRITQEFFKEEFYKNFLYENYNNKIRELNRIVIKQTVECLSKVEEACKNGTINEILLQLESSISKANEQIQGFTKLYFQNQKPKLIIAPTKIAF